ncbi:hypothetical protein COT72_03660 [archaeon CG10_big_fil_rev_8_21_14_0_10_43_11]|nr:MAG: hypothetical protein COT72_03660 [archaeon CG10_big_fil_rev_8_21_14_0_10_43_11]
MKLSKEDILKKLEDARKEYMTERAKLRKQYPELAKHEEEGIRLHEEREKEKQDFLNSLTPKQKELRERITPVIRAISFYQGKKYFTTKDEMQDYIVKGSKKLEKEMDELTSIPLKDIQSVLMGLQRDRITIAYTSYKETGKISLWFVTITG